MVIEKWCNRLMIALTNPIIALAGFTLYKVFGTLEIFAISFCQIIVKPKKVLPFERGTPGTVLYGKSGPGYCITFIKILDGGLR